MSVLTKNNFIKANGLMSYSDVNSADIEVLQQTATDMGYDEFSYNDSGDLLLKKTEVVGSYTYVTTFNCRTEAVSFEAAIIKTATPTIVVQGQGLTTTTVTVEGVGTLRMYIDGNPSTFPAPIAHRETARDIVITATAQEQGKAISDTATLELTLPALLVTDTPVISAVNNDNGTTTITATGNGDVVLYADGVQVDNPYTVNQTEEVQTLTMTATAKETSKLISATATQVVTVPALPAAEPETQNENEN